MQGCDDACVRGVNGGGGSAPRAPAGGGGGGGGGGDWREGTAPGRLRGRRCAR